MELMLSKWMVLVSMVLFSFPALFSDFISLGGTNFSHSLKNTEDILFLMFFSICLTICVYISFYVQISQVPLRWQHGRTLLSEGMRLS